MSRSVAVGVLVAAADGWLLADLDPGDPVVSTCEQLLRGGADAAAVRTVMTGSSAGHWALVRLGEQGGWAMVVGDATVELQVGVHRAVVRSASPGVVRTHPLPARPNRIGLALPG